MSGYIGRKSLLLGLFTPFLVCAFLGGCGSSIQKYAKEGNIASVQSAVESGVRPEELEESLRIACRYGHDDVFFYLIGLDTEFNLDPSLHTAAVWGRSDYVRKLLDAGARGDISNSLLIAAGNGHIDVVSQLIDAGAEVNYVEPGSITGYTPLLNAVDHGHLPVVKLLLENGANIETQATAYTVDDRGRIVTHVEGGNTSLTLALANRQVDIANILCEHGAQDDKVVIWQDASGLMLSMRQLVGMAGPQGRASVSGDVTPAKTGTAYDVARLKGVSWETCD